MLTVTPIEAFSDNYIWCLHREGDVDAFVVDPGDAAPVLAALQQRGLTLAGVLVTHHHYDHVGGLDGLLEQARVPVYGPHNPAVPQITHRLAEGDEITVLGQRFRVLQVPGHTLDHIAYFGEAETPLLFCGDTLFAGGCGRIFEGNPSMMYQSLQALAGLPPETQVYCAHEYTMANLAFAQAVEPGNVALEARIAADAAKRERGLPTVPSILSLELDTNPFLRSSQPELSHHLPERENIDAGNPVEVFAAVRGWKDNF